MTPRPVGRPRAFDREQALREAARLFWRHGFSGTSTRMLTGALGISSSSLYSAFGTKAALFDEAVRTYAQRYSAVYDRAVGEPTPLDAVHRLLVESVEEFTRADEGHPGCLPSSAVMADSSSTLDVRTFVAELQLSDEARLLGRFAQAQQAGELPDAVPAELLASLVQTIWQGLSARAELGASRSALLEVAELATASIARLIEPSAEPRPHTVPAPSNQSSTLRRSASGAS